MELVDLLGLVAEELKTSLPFSWVAFAADVSNVFAAKSHFVESTDEAWMPFLGPWVSDVLQFSSFQVFNF